MDYALMQSGIVVMDTNGEVLKGQVQIKEAERQWCFMPEQPWTVGSYKIRVSHDLEDLGGNNLVRLFDADPVMDDKKQEKPLNPYIELPFTVVVGEPKE